MSEKPSSVLARHAGTAQWADLTPEQRRKSNAHARDKSPAALAYWTERVDPLGELSEDERLRRATAERSSYFRDMAIRREQRRREQRGASDVAA
ncbi:hypothetical protein ACFYOK_10755 [Microbispora bryophytorum]|uniref:hypothetical protein n=1 Tax=Microbispora bryophytorum TaxID=1460882 RepID=UPI0033E1D47C